MVFLCLECHDRYDSRTSQSKNFTTAEVKGFRAELDTAKSSAFPSDVRFGEPATPECPGINGQYIRIGGGSSSAELTVRALPSGEIRVIGVALWGTNREYGPNTGTLDFLANLQANLAVFEDHLPGDDRPYIARLTFADGSVVVDEENPLGYFGMNVSFAGTYAKATQ